MSKDKKSEAGNIWFVGTEPDPEPKALLKAIFAYLFIVLFFIASMAIVAGATGWFYQTFIGA